MFIRNVNVIEDSDFDDFLVISILSSFPQNFINVHLTELSYFSVCTRWRDVGNIWRDVTELIIHDYDGMYDENENISVSGNVLTIQMTKDVCLQGIVDRTAPSLRYLRDRRRTGDTIVSIIQPCRGLRVLEISIGSMLDDMRLSYLILRNTSLKSFHLTLTNNDFCTSLAAINANTIQQLTVFTSTSSISTLRPELIDLMKRVQKLEAFGCNFGDDNTIELVSTMSTLKTWTIDNGVLSLTDRSFTSILNAEKLTCISLASQACYESTSFDFSQDFFVALVARCPLLQEVELKSELTVPSNLYRLMTLRSLNLGTLLGG